MKHRSPVPQQLIGALCLLAAWTTLGEAQEVRTELACDGLSISAIEFQTEAPAVYRDAPGWTRPMLRFAMGRQRTDSTAVKPFILLEPGEQCSEFLLEESERLLRAQTYLADATIVAVPDEDGGVRLVVATSDDVPLVAGGSIRKGAPRRVLLGTANLLGRGMMVAAEWENGYEYRQGFGAHFEHYHAFGGPQRVALSAVRGPRHELLDASISLPYFTDAQRNGWYLGGERRKDYLGFPEPGTFPVSQNISREIYGAAAITRVGSRSRRLLMGLSAVHESVDPIGSGVLVTDSGFVDAPDELPSGIFERTRSTRAGVVVGGRWLDYESLYTLDTLSGRQDLPSGMLVLATAGYEFGSEESVAAGSASRNVRQPFFMADAYTGAVWDRGFLALNAGVEGRRDPEGGWRDFVAGAHAGWYRRMSDRRTRALSLEFSGTWNSSRPYRLLMSNWRDGVRGYRGSQVSGGRLAVLRLEERWAAGGYGDMIGVGGALFTDIGKMWADDVPRGYTTRLRMGVGAGLLVAVPRNSQAFYRVDVAMPVMRDRDAKPWTLRVSRQLPYTVFWREPSGLERARAARPEAALIGIP